MNHIVMFDYTKSKELQVSDEELKELNSELNIISSIPPMDAYLTNSPEEKIKDWVEKHPNWIYEPERFYTTC